MRTETLDLTWNDVDWKDRIVYLGQVDSKTKFRRPFPITDQLFDLLKELQQDKDDSDHVFRRFKGWASNISQHFQRLRKGLMNCLITLRHIFSDTLLHLT